MTTEAPTLPAPRPPEQRTVRVEDLRKVRTLAAGLLSLADGATAEELENLGIAPAQVEELRKALQTAERTIPTARELAMAGMSGSLPKEMVLTGYARGQRGIHALAPLVVLRIADKIDNDQAPGSTRLLIELAKGLGLFVPAEPIAAPKRSTLLDLDAEREKPLDVLKAELLRRTA